MLALTDLHKVAETWMNTSHAIFDDDEAHKVPPPPPILHSLAHDRLAFLMRGT